MLFSIFFMWADLHIHTFYSDGTFSPRAVVERAHKIGLDIIAITDHDSLRGSALAINIAAAHNVRVVAGAEFTGALNGEEIHILGYFPSLPEEPVTTHLRRMQEFRRQRAYTAVERLRGRGYDVSPHDLPTPESCDSLTTVHVAMLLARRGFAASIREAWVSLLNPKVGIVPQFETSCREVIDVIHAGRGLAVWAHPDVDGFEPHLEALCAAGLDGIEVANLRRDATPAAELVAYAQKRGLVMTGGSDWHGLTPLGPGVSDSLCSGLLERLAG